MNRTIPCINISAILRTKQRRVIKIYYTVRCEVSDICIASFVTDSKFLLKAIDINSFYYSQHFKGMYV